MLEFHTFYCHFEMEFDFFLPPEFDFVLFLSVVKLNTLIIIVC